MNTLPQNIPDYIQNAINDFVYEVNRIFGNRIKKLYLYGSYARGDFRDNSDIDIFVLTNETDEENENILNILSDIAYNIEETYDFDIFISPNIENIHRVEELLDVSFLFQNLLHEGVEIQ